MTTLDAWRAGGERTTVRLAARPRQIFQRIGGAGTWCTLLHGFPTSSFDWHEVWDAVCVQRRVLALDFLGFGDSDKPADHDYSIHEQADLVQALWQHHGLRESTLIAHDYGVSVAQELLARLGEGRLDIEVSRVVFLNGGLYPELHRAQPVQKMLLDPEQGPRLGSLITEESFARGLASTFGPEHQPTREALRQQWRAVAHGDGHLIGHKLIQYIPDRLRHRDRWVHALESTAVPRHFLWGDRDPVSGGHMADRIAERLPDADLVRFADVGHWPQLEVPEAIRHHLTRILGDA